MERLGGGSYCGDCGSCAGQHRAPQGPTNSECDAPSLERSPGPVPRRNLDASRESSSRPPPLLSLWTHWLDVWRMLQLFRSSCVPVLVLSNERRGRGGGRRE